MLGALSYSSLAWLLFSLSGCAEYKFKNYPAYGSLGAAGAAQFDTLDTKSSIITLDQFIALWKSPVDPLIALHVSSYEDLITGLQTLCSDHPGSCTEEVVSTMNAESAKLNRYKRMKEAMNGLEAVHAGVLEGGSSVDDPAVPDSTSVAPRAVDAAAPDVQ